jgi:hypothetical protein
MATKFTNRVSAEVGRHAKGYWMVYGTCNGLYFEADVQDKNSEKGIYGSKITKLKITEGMKWVLLFDDHKFITVWSERSKKEKQYQKVFDLILDYVVRKKVWKETYMNRIASESFNARQSKKTKK